MKSNRKKGKAHVQEEMTDQVQKILQERGSKALEMARQAVLEEKIECKEVREALHYFMTKYWHDLARPTLLSLACEAVGGDPDMTTPIAVPMILISGAIDIHDDIIDQSKIKESGLTVLGKFGRDIALLVGDALLFKGLVLLQEAICKDVSAEKATMVFGIIKDMFTELGDAEALELSFRRRTDITPEEYLYVVTKKAADIEAYTRISATIGGGSKEEIDLLGKYGRILGLMAILRDDLADMFNFHEFSNRIKHECLPLPILFALQNSDMKSKIEALLKEKKLVRKDAEAILNIIRKADSLERFIKLMKELHEEAISYVNKLKHTQESLKILAESLIPILQ